MVIRYLQYLKVLRDCPYIWKTTKRIKFLLEKPCNPPEMSSINSRTNFEGYKSMLFHVFWYIEAYKISGLFSSITKSIALIASKFK